MNSTFRTVVIWVVCLCNLALAFEGSDIRRAFETAGLLSVVVAVVLSFVAWLLSVSRRFATRPLYFTPLIFGTLGGAVAGLCVAYFEFEGELAALIFAGLVVALPVLAWLSEWVLASVMARLGGRLRQGGRAGAASRALSVASALRPRNRTVRDLLATMLATDGKAAEAQPMLQEMFARGYRGEEFLKLFYINSRAVGERAMQIAVGEELDRLSPSDELFEDLVALWLSSGAEDTVILRIGMLDQLKQDDHLPTLFELLLKRRNFERCLHICVRMLETGAVRAADVDECLARLIAADPGNVVALERRRDLALQIGDAKTVSRVVEQLLALDPTNAPSRRLLIENLRKSEQLNSVIAQIKILAGQNQASVTDWFELAYWHFGRSEAAEALAILDKHLPVAQMPEAAYVKAKCLEELGRTQEALQTAQDAMARHRNAKPDPTLPEYVQHTDIARELRTLAGALELHLNTLALEKAEEQVEKNPDDTPARLEWIALLAKANRVSQAIIAYDDFLRKSPDDFDRVMAHLEQLRAQTKDNQLGNFRIDLLERTADWPKMLNASEELVKDTVNASQHLAKLYERILGKAPAFTPALDNLLVLARKADTATQANALVCLDNFYANGGECNEARACTELLLAVRCADFARGRRLCEMIFGQQPAHNDIATATDECLELAMEVYTHETEYEHAIAVREETCKRKKLQPETDTMLIGLKKKANEKREAQLRKQIADTPADPELWNALGDLMHLMGRRNDAITAYQKAAQRKTEKEDVYRAKYAYELLLKGPSFYGEAEIAFKEVNLDHEMPPEYQETIKALLHLAARVVTNENQWDFALELYKRIFRIDAGYANTVAEIDRIEGILRTKRNK